MIIFVCMHMYYNFAIMNNRLCLIKNTVGNMFITVNTNEKWKTQEKKKSFHKTFYIECTFI